jgi:hypothetical protein
MADKDPVWSLGESQLLYSPTTGLDTEWSLGESLIFDEYIASGLAALNIYGIEMPWAQSANYR